MANERDRRTADQMAQEAQQQASGQAGGIEFTGGVRDFLDARDRLVENAITTQAAANNSGGTVDNPNIGQQTIPPPISLTQQYLDIISALLTASLPFFGTGSETVKIEIPTEETLVSELSYVNSATYKLSANYNFYTDYFEDISKNSAQVLEAALPSLYIVGDEANRKTIYEPIITISGNLDIDPSDGSAQYEYFDEFAKLYNKQIKSPLPDTLFVPLANMQSRVYYTKQGVKRLEEINQNRYLMPFTNKINFKKIGLSAITAILEDTDFLDGFCKSIIQNFETSLSAIQMQFLLQSLSINQDQIIINEESAQQTVNGRRFANINEFIDSLNRQSSITSLGDIHSDIQAQQTQSQSSSLSQAIRKMIFLKKLRQLMDLKKQTIEQFLSRFPALKGQPNNKPSPLYSEILMYELNKSASNQRLQSFYIPNLNEQTAINLFDAQIKFGKEYNYTMNTVEIAFGQKLNFDLSSWSNKIALGNLTDLLSQLNEQLTAIGATDFLQRIKNDPSFATLNPAIYKLCLEIVLKWVAKNNIQAFVYYPIIFKKQIFSDVITVYDNPPPPPEVEIDGMIGIDDKILIRLNSSISEFKSSPIIIQSEDIQVYQKNVASQKLENFEDEMMFDGDDRIDYFQIFRIKEHPKQYTDFKDSFVTASTTTQIYKDVNFGACDSLKANHSSYTDTIEANQEYYYIFRSVDVHGNISNPSPIYNINMVNQDGTIYPIIKIVDLLKQDGVKNTKEAKRFLYISPNAIQALINEQETGFFTAEGNIKDTADLVKDNIVLGLSEQRLWNKNYRLKIRSKNTGKTVEVDFKFIHKILTNDANCK